MASKNLAAWSPSPKGDLEVKEAPLYEVHDDEILIQVHNYFALRVFLSISRS
jgi:hypothetical protein